MKQYPAKVFLAWAEAMGGNEKIVHQDLNKNKPLGILVFPDQDEADEGKKIDHENEEIETGVGGNLKDNLPTVRDEQRTAQNDGGDEKSSDTEDIQPLADRLWRRNRRQKGGRGLIGWHWPY